MHFFDPTPLAWPAAAAIVLLKTIILGSLAHNWQFRLPHPNTYDPDYVQQVKQNPVWNVIKPILLRFVIRIGVKVSPETYDTAFGPMVDGHRPKFLPRFVSLRHRLDARWSEQIKYDWQMFNRWWQREHDPRVYHMICANVGIEPDFNTPAPAHYTGDYEDWKRATGHGATIFPKAWEAYF